MSFKKRLKPEALRSLNRRQTGTLQVPGNTTAGFIRFFTGINRRYGGRGCTFFGAKMQNAAYKNGTYKGTGGIVYQHNIGFVFARKIFKSAKNGFASVRAADDKFGLQSRLCKPVPHKRTGIEGFKGFFFMIRFGGDGYNQT